MDAEDDAKKEEELNVFYRNMEKSDDLKDNLDEFCHFLQQKTGATGVYIGRLVPPLKAITDEDHDTAHIDEENPKVLHFQHTSEDHKFMLDKILKPEEGISHDIFKEPS